MDLLILLVGMVCVGGVYTLLIFKYVERKHLRTTDVLLNSQIALSTSVDKVHKRIDSLFTVDPSSPNEATKTDPDVSDLSEQNMYIPDNVKFEVEGGTTTPPESEPET